MTDTSTVTEDAGRDRLGRRLSIGLAVASLAALLTCHVLWIDEPFDASLGGVTSGEYYGIAAKAFDRFGMLELAFTPVVFFQNGTSTTAARYINHPFGPHLITYPSYRFFGRDERALRLPLLLVAFLAHLWLWRGMRDFGIAAPITVALLATTPLMVQYGNMVDAPMFSLALLILGANAWRLHVAQPTRRRYAWYFVIGLAGAFCDWFGYFLVPAIWVDLALARRGRFYRNALLAAAPFGIGFAAFFAWTAWSAGSLEAATQNLLTLLGVAAPRGPSFSAPVEIHYFADMWTWLSTRVGTLRVLVAAIGILIALRRRDAFGRLTLLLAIAGVLPSIAFWSRAAIHDFWILTLTPAIAAGIALALTKLGEVVAARLGGARATLVVLVAVGGLCFTGLSKGIDLHDGYRTVTHRSLASAMNSFASADDVVLTPATGGPMRFYAESTVVPMMTEPSVLHYVLRHLEPGRTEIRKLWLAVPTSLMHEFLWAGALPLLTLTAGEADYEVGWGEGRFGAKLFYCEVDVEKMFRSIE